MEAIHVQNVATVARQVFVGLERNAHIRLRCSAHRRVATLAKDFSANCAALAREPGNTAGFVNRFRIKG